MEQLERLNAAVYWLTYSPLLEPFTVKPKTAEDLKPEDERIKIQKCVLCPAPDDTPVPPDLGPEAIYTESRTGPLAQTRSFPSPHQNHRRQRITIPEKERAGACHSTGQRRGASPVHSQL